MTAAMSVEIPPVIIFAKSLLRGAKCHGYFGPVLRGSRVRCTTFCAESKILCGFDESLSFLRISLISAAHTGRFCLVGATLSLVDRWHHFPPEFQTLKQYSPRSVFAFGGFFECPECGLLAGPGCKYCASARGWDGWEIADAAIRKDYLADYPPPDSPLVLLDQEMMGLKSQEVKA